MRNKRCCFLFFLLLLFCCLLMSCSTTTMTNDKEVVTEYVPVELDLSDLIGVYFANRPDNSELNINTSNILELKDIVLNSLEYQKAWYNWQGYAELLEGFVLEIQDTYGPKSANT